MKTNTIKEVYAQNVDKSDNLHNRFEDLDGVCLAGGGIQPGSGLPVIYESSRISSQLLLEDLGIDHLFAACARRNTLGAERAGAYETVG